MKAWLNMILLIYFAPLVVIADGCFSSFRKQFISFSSLMLSSIYHQPFLLFYHFFAVVLYAIYLATMSSFFNIFIGPFIFLQGCRVIFPYIWSELIH
ncbi:hypothetical protein PCK1_001051 [Pneumocystis canis]|nr:hypothetical protein PCK1_001051 [Pneumocystis canis]